MSDRKALAVFDFHQERNISKKIKDLLDKRTSARKAKDFTKADQIRDQLLKHNISVEDTAEGQTWYSLK